MPGMVEFDTATWTDKWIKALSPTQKILFFYLWTNNHKNLIAMYNIDIEQIAFELNLDLPIVKDDMKVLYPKVEFDYEKNIVWVVNHVRKTYLRSEKISPKIIEGIRRCLISMKGHKFVKKFLNEYKFLNLFNSNIPYPYPIDRYPYPKNKDNEKKSKSKKKIPYEEGFNFVLEDDKFITQLKETYADKDVDQEIKKAKLWLISKEWKYPNGTLYVDFRRFLRNWMEKAKKKVGEIVVQNSVLEKIKKLEEMEE